MSRGSQDAEQGIPGRGGDQEHLSASGMPPSRPVRAATVPGDSLRWDGTGCVWRGCRVRSCREQKAETNEKSRHHFTEHFKGYVVEFRLYSAVKRDDRMHCLVRRGNWPVEVLCGEQGPGRALGRGGQNRAGGDEARPGPVSLGLGRRGRSRKTAHRQKSAGPWTASGRTAVDIWTRERKRNVLTSS